MKTTLRTFKPVDRERGVVLFIALIALVAMALAGIATMRSVSSGLLVAGNLAFKRQATSAADRGVEEALAWYLLQAPGSLDNTNATQGYYAEWDDFDPTVAGDWINGSAVKLSPTQTPLVAQEVWYVIHRLCEGTGPVDPTTCVTADTGGAGSTQVGGVYGSGVLTGAGRVYYRVTARVIGTKGTVSLIQTTVF